MPAEKPSLDQLVLDFLRSRGLASDLLDRVAGDLSTDSSHPSSCLLEKLFRYASEGIMDVAVSRLSGSTEFFEVWQWTSVRDFKSMIEAQLQIPVHEQVLLKNGRELKGDCLATHHLTFFSAELEVLQTEVREVPTEEESLIVTFKRAEGIPEGSILSVRAGTKGRQTQLRLDEPLKFPTTKEAAKLLKLDVFVQFGKARLALRPGAFHYTAELQSDEGLPVGSLDFEATDSTEKEKHRQAPVTSEVYGPSRRTQEHVRASSYLDEHGLIQYLQGLLQNVLREKPSDPYQYMIQQLQAARAARPAAAQEAVVAQEAAQEAEAAGQLGRSESTSSLPQAWYLQPSATPWMYCNLLSGSLQRREQ
eukprot:TRINITY_DN65919_c0_g1_i1.p1 TRINITY_DN65919_c0_g1~~TRINITY_DN65919_c0_g1_i1.p1  ORF type:complete len:371 (-),score=104.88 TRINITY_DN65919_c0_g1_i1:65-1153(-)